MKSIIWSRYSKLYLLSFAVTVITAWFSEGYYHPDEHFQILEFAGYRLGQSPAADLPWEFGEQMRPALQPAIACGVISASKCLGITNPFLHAFFLRLLAGLFGWYVICRICRLLVNDFSTEKSRILFVTASLLLWFMPYLIVRFSSETLAGTTFLFSLTLLLEHLRKTQKSGNLIVAFAGLLLGFSFFLRFHLGFAILGLVAWLIFVRKARVRVHLLLLSAAVAAMVICVSIDFWFYKEFVLTPVRFFIVNIIQDRAANWGVMPWYYYFPQVIWKIVPPVSLVLLPAFFFGMYKKPLSVFTFIIIPFLAAHMIVGHKETRFLFPMAFPFLYLAWTGLDDIAGRIRNRKVLRYTFRVLAGVNLVLLFYVMFFPAQVAMKYYRFIYNYPGPEKQILISEKKSAYSLVGQEVNFFKPPGVSPVTILSLSETGRYLDRTRSGSALLLSRKMTLSLETTAYDQKRIYSFFPGWIWHFNYNHWMERSNTWSVYKVKRKNRFN